MKSFKYTTEVEVTPSPWKISHTTGILTLGSCFAEVIGRQLEDRKFDVLNNPFGTIFNPISLARLLDLSLEGQRPDPKLYFKNADGVVLHHDLHSAFWAKDQKVLESEITTRCAEVKTRLQTAKVLVLTLGTAFAYRHRGSNQIISNCHKVPAAQFVKELLHPDQMALALEKVIFKLQLMNRDLKIILTVSPVRHTRDTLALNQVSKSTLRLVSHRLAERFKQVSYFPAYEIMVDELRDYRFYAEDLIHPSAVAENHIFSIFAENYVEQGSRELMKEWEQIRAGMQHRPLHGDTASQKKMLHSLAERLRAVSDKIDVGRELTQINERIQQFPGI